MQWAFERPTARTHECLVGLPRVFDARADPVHLTHELLPLVAELPEWREQAYGMRQSPGSDFFHALRALEALWRAQGKVIVTTRLHVGARLRIDRLEWMLAVLVRAGCITRVGAHGWTLSDGAGTTTVRDIYRLFVFNPPTLLAGRPAMTEFEARINALDERAGVDMELTLAEFFRETGG